MSRSFTLRNVVITGAFCAAYVMLSASSSTTPETRGQLVFNNALSHLSHHQRRGQSP